MERYDRQIKFNSFGVHGQEKMMSSAIMVMGAGALGSHVSEMLTRMGAGRIIVIDMDIIEMSNLHRQTLYTEKDAERMRPKVEVLKERLGEINSDADIITVNIELDSNNISAILQKYQPDIVIDGMDHFEIRFLINEACHKYDIPWIYGAAVGSKGSVYGIDFKGPCLKCLMETMPTTGESCEINGVLPPVITQVASMEVSEAIRLLSRQGFSGKLISADSFKMDYRTMDAGPLKSESCKVCGQGIYELLDKNDFTAVQSNCGNVYTLRFHEDIFHGNFPGDVIRQNQFVKFISYKEYEMTLFKDGRMNVYGLSDVDDANILYREITNQINMRV